MGKSNVAQIKLAESYLGDGGTRFRRYCGMSGGAWCCAFVSCIFGEAKNASLFYGGKTVVYVPTAKKWCEANLANIPIYLALPSDIVFFDWNNNGTPDHIGFARERESDQVLLTVEGNTSGGIVANKKRTVDYISGCYRPNFPAKYKIGTLTVDGQFGYDSIAMLQTVLGIKVDGILGKKTVKALQKKAGVAQDGSWGKKTSKAVQKMIGAKADGWFGENSVKALQKWINAEYKDGKLKKWQKGALDYAKMLAKSNYKYVLYSSGAWAHECPICHPKVNNKGGNCIWFAFACLHHGGGIKCKCSCDVINNQTYDKLLKVSLKKATQIVQDRMGIKKVEVIRNGGQPIPFSSLEPGDVVVYYVGTEYRHTALYVGDGKIADCTSGRKQAIKYGVKSYTSMQIKVAIRYTGK